MDSFSAFALGAANRDKELMVFDWVGAAKILRDNRAVSAAAGLRGDWEWTGGAILENGTPVPKDHTYTYLASTWATPELEYQTEGGDTHIEACFKMQSELPDHGSDTYWPDEAKAEYGIIDGMSADITDQKTLPNVQ